MITKKNSEDRRRKFTNRFRSTFSNFRNDPFKALDSLDLSFNIFNQRFQINFLRDDVKLRAALLPLIFLITVVWAFGGFDSSIGQVNYLIQYLPDLVLRNISFNDWIQLYLNDYGKGMHYSAAVIYLLVFVGFSKHLRKLGSCNSENFCLSFGLTALQIPLFEFLWMILFAHYQNQLWVITFQWAQSRIILQNLLMLFVGVLTLAALDWRKYKPNLNRLSLLLFALTVLSFYLWIDYGRFLPVQPLIVTLSDGSLWRNSPYFPQTVYTIDLTPNDSFAFGNQFYVENDAIHFVNTVSKILMSMSLYNILKIERR